MNALCRKKAVTRVADRVAARYGAATSDAFVWYITGLELPTADILLIRIALQAIWRSVFVGKPPSQSPFPSSFVE